ncbi:hypothetical protein [Thermocrispum municipale]|jgi:hypothetical protein|uniref:hypothetical protein n=1 Tax=Thermocrispum municipale TaxID=37926 RepID=UPI00041317D8|nr:hypothetical protein [Thermocrispum municipale]
MRTILFVPVLLVVLVLAACTTSPPPQEPTKQATSAPTTTPAAPTTTTAKPTKTATGSAEASMVEPVKQTPEQPRYSCEPDAPAKFDDPNSPHIITNKDCPEINAAKERSHREYVNCLANGRTWDIDRQRCADSPQTQEPPSSDTRDVNGETKAEYCARIGYTGDRLKDCPAG